VSFIEEVILGVIHFFNQQEEMKKNPDEESGEVKINVWITFHWRV